MSFSIICKTFNLEGKQVEEHAFDSEIPSYQEAMKLMSNAEAWAISNYGPARTLRTGTQTVRVTFEAPDNNKTFKLYYIELFPDAE